MPRRLTFAVIPLVVLALALVGCTESTRLPPPEPPAANEPLFASDEEALAAATAAYEEYLAVVDAALADPSATADSLGAVAAGDALREVQNSVSTFADRGWRFDGTRLLTDVELQQAVHNEERVLVVMYVCESVSGVDVLDEQGVSVVEATRPDLTAFEVALEISSARAHVVERVLWSDQRFCLR